MDWAARSSRTHAACGNWRACSRWSPAWCDLLLVLGVVLGQGKIAARRGLCHHLAQETTLLCEDEFVLLGKVEIRHALGVTAKPGAIGFVGRQALERDQREGDVVGALMRHEIACEIAAASGNDGERALERIDLVADENGDGHDETPMLVAIVANANAAVIPGWCVAPGMTVPAQWRDRLRKLENTRLPFIDASLMIEV